jgi:hypothetical protein
MKNASAIQSSSWHFKANDRNDDDAMKAIAAKAYELGEYPFDTL